MLKKLIKVSKRCGALFCAALVAVGGVTLPVKVNAQITEINRTYDKSSNSSVIIANTNHRYITDGGVTVTNERFDSLNTDPVFPNKSAITIVPDPVSKDYSDKVVRIAKDSSWTNTANGTVNQYGNQIPIKGIKSVTSFNFMLSGDLIQKGNHPLKLIMQSSSYSKNFLIAKVSANADNTKNILYATSGSNVELEQDKWYNITMVCDLSNSDARYMAFYLNGAVISEFDEEAIAARTDLDTSTIIGYILQPGVTSGTESVLYYDDYRVYEVGSEDEARVELASPAAASTYMNGARVKLEAKTYLGSDLQMIEKVEYYDGSAKIASSDAAPYTCYWTPAKSGAHNITAKMYLTGVSQPVVSDAVSINIDRAFEEDVVTSITDYNGTVDPAVSPGTWRISAAEPVTIDTEHGSSMRVKSGGNYWVNVILPQQINSGYVKISGEYYVDSHVITEDGEGNKTATANTVNNTLIGNMVGGDAADNFISQISGTTYRTYINKTQNMSNLETLNYERWYKIDIITKVKPAGKQGYLKIYIDGKKAYDSELPSLYKNGNVGDANVTSLKAIDKINAVTFAQLYNSGTMVLDNLSVSKITPDYEPMFYSDGEKITDISEIKNGELTVKTVGEDEDEVKLIMAMYEGDSLVDVQVGSLESNGREHSASFDLSSYSTLNGKSIKAFVFDGMSTIRPLGSMNELN